ncbi:transposase [Trichonephila clavipes]|nr:transposase [Trichonephila clavipes]
MTRKIPELEPISKLPHRDNGRSLGHHRVNVHQPFLHVPTDDIVRRVFIESSALEKGVGIQSGMDADWADFVSSQDNLQRSCPVGLDKNAGATRFNILYGRKGCVLARTVESNQGGRFDGKECVADSFRSGAVSFKVSRCQVIYSQFGLSIHQNDHQARRRFVEWAQNEIAVVPDLHKRILFSDEAQFWLNSYVNKQNGRIWSDANPQVYVETPLHPEKLTVWCALWAGGITGPYFFKNDEGHNVTVNGDRYRVMITNFFIPELNNHDVQELWFQQRRRNMSLSSCHNLFFERHVW